MLFECFSTAAEGVLVDFVLYHLLQPELEAIGGESIP
jgi:hypothetical protein